MESKPLTTEELLRRHREKHQEATMSGNAGGFAVPLGAPLRRVPEPPYEEVPRVKRRRSKKKKR